MSFIYDAAGRRASTLLPGGISQQYTYDGAGRIERIEYSVGANVLGDLRYGYDAEGNISSVGGTYARTQLPDAMSAAVYDAAGR